LWWNLALEDQAFDGAIARGKHATSTPTSLENTVERRIPALQDSKRALATAALGGDKIKNVELGLEDLVALFRPGREEDDWFFV
jgi:SNF2 family DNA or RNA helicase